MKKTKTTKASPTKKGNVAEIAYRTLLAIEFNKQNLLQDIKNWNERFLPLEQSIDRIEKVTKKELVIKSQELSKEFNNAQSQIAKLTKEMETARNHLNKAQVKFETKLSEPFSKGNFSSQEPKILEETKQHIAKIQELFLTCKQSLDPMSERGLACTKRLSLLENIVNKLCLSDEMDEANKINDKLNTRFKDICQETAKFFDSPNPDQYDTQKVTTTFLQLFKEHREGEKLLQQIQNNLHISSISESPEVKRSPSPKHN